MNSQAIDIPASKILNPDFIAVIRSQYRLDWQGIHGSSHWSRVRLNGLLLAPSTGADTSVIEYFAFLHDACRRNDNVDPGHGPRAAKFARSIRAEHITLTDAQFELLTVALDGHTREATHPDPTIATCWDADRLDLGRINIYPDSSRLCTDAAQQEEFIKEAWKRSRAGKAR